MARKKAVDLPRFTPSKAKNAIAVAKVIAPAVLPVVTPYLVRSAAVVRDSWDRRKARKLGVSVDDLGHYSGRGGALHARIAGAANAVAELRTKSDASADDRAFADEAEQRLRQLAAAVRAAERMPTARRRAAHRAVGTELARLEDKVLTALGV
ncbi:DUF6474 family protein [Actinokineospora globicatena]|uniref:Uncharacterized protein n=1 Tax=Actinokineospora globicatena TaxID=103729 RepID=A0A9W6QL66_9PSEU|nr:DUF6474 family protein [Actinokineospora globicatena]MCP2301210.1 hypothetical protein [Actinokineospora globicatena]GLW77154.1 hypothetical protein Aglo01_16360 [Actinokineospora globicatena]GLW83988.1 hypothetical protein Aglo02_16280 [Actinokineospora globicatena]GLW92066.1 hypothetical protein Aglo03_28820 [Actinokineospora globicatena]